MVNEQKKAKVTVEIKSNGTWEEFNNVFTWLDQQVNLHPDLDIEVEIRDESY